MIHKHKINYRPIYQLPYCCVPATLQWILYKRNLDILDQETIGVELGLRLPEKGKRMFKNKGIIFLQKEPKRGFGTQIHKKKYSINNFFKQNNISLTLSEEYHFTTEKKLEDFLIKNFKQNNDIVLRYHSKVFKKQDEKGVGHLSVMVEYNDKTKKTTIGDPYPPFYKKISLEDLLFSTSDKIDNIQRGLYSISEV